jgi:hypothetical protein
MTGVQLAIEYPEKYKYSKNYFNKNIVIKVTEKLAINTPEYIHSGEIETHLYMLPPMSYNKLETNKNTKLKLGYKMQSIYDSTSKQYQYQDYHQA